MWDVTRAAGEVWQWAGACEAAKKALGVIEGVGYGTEVGDRVLDIAYRALAEAMGIEAAKAAGVEEPRDLSVGYAIAEIWNWLWLSGSLTSCSNLVW